MNSFWLPFFDTLSKAINIFLKPCPTIIIPCWRFVQQVPGWCYCFCFTGSQDEYCYIGNPQAPLRGLLKGTLMSFPHLEIITHTIRRSVSSVYKTWNPALTFVETLPSLEIWTHPLLFSFSPPAFLWDNLGWAGVMELFWLYADFYSSIIVC